MEELFRWALITAFVVSLVTYILNFITSSLGIRILVALLLTAVSIVIFMRKFGLPDEGFRTGATIGLCAMAGLAVVMTKDLLEYILTLLLFVIAYFIGGLVGKYSLPVSEPRERKKRKENEEEEEEEPEEIEETEVSGE